MLLLSETHGTEGGNRAWTPPLGCSAWWSAGPTAGTAGVGVMANNSFLQQIAHQPKWIVISPGRAAVLSLRGDDGFLDVVVTYFHTGGQLSDLDRRGVRPDSYDYCNSFPRLREHLRTRIGRAIKPQEQVLTVLGGRLQLCPGRAGHNFDQHYAE